MRATRLAAAVACACGLSACASMSEKMATDMSQNSLIGLPATAPARPEAPPAFPAVHDIPPPRGNSVLSNTEQVRMEEELVAARDQLNGTAARTIIARFVALHGGDFPTPEQVLATPIERMRACGYSAGKVASIRDIAEKADRKSTRLNSSHT